MGKVSGAHLNPAVSIAFALRGDFPWRRVPGYIVVQLGGAALAAWFLQAVVARLGHVRLELPGAGASRAGDAFVMETVLTFGLVSVILGTASGAQNLGVIGALGVGGYIALAGLWGSPISGASMNPARTFGPDRRRRRLPRLLGVRRRAARRGGHRRRRRLRPPRARRRAGRVRGCAGRAPHRGSQAGESLGAHRAPQRDGCSSVTSAPWSGVSNCRRRRGVSVSSVSAASCAGAGWIALSMPTTAGRRATAR